VTDKQFKKLSDLVSNENYNGTIREPIMGWWGRPIGDQKMVFNFTIKPHSYKVFKIE
jgi:hypothetical protein